MDGDKQRGRGPDGDDRETATEAIGGPLALVNNVRNVRAILEQAKEGFGPETRRVVETLITSGKIDTKRIENQDFGDLKIDPSAWLYLATMQLTEVVQELLMLSASNASATIGETTGRRV